MYNPHASRNSLYVVFLSFLSVLNIGCNKDDDVGIKTGPAPAWAPKIDRDMLAVIEQFESYDTPPLNSLTPQQARQAPTPLDAVAEIVRINHFAEPVTPINITHMLLPANTPEGILTRIYTPEGKGPFPVIVYFHGGGWVIGDLDSYEPSARALSSASKAIVVSVAYRQAPEYKFPAAHEDAFEAYRWATQHAQEINGDTTRIAVAGESAGGNLAAAVCLMAREVGLPLPVHQLLIYPVTDYGFDTPSYAANSNARPLDAASMQWFFQQYLEDAEAGENLLISLINVPDVSGLPPATIITAEYDPLLSEGKAYADKLEAAGVKVLYRNFEGVTHEFFGMASIVNDAREAQALAGKELAKAFVKN